MPDIVLRIMLEIINFGVGVSPCFCDFPTLQERPRPVELSKFKGLYGGQHHSADGRVEGKECHPGVPPCQLSFPVGDFLYRPSKLSVSLYSAESCKGCFGKAENSIRPCNSRSLLRDSLSKKLPPPNTSPFRLVRERIRVLGNRYKLYVVLKSA